MPHRAHIRALAAFALCAAACAAAAQTPQQREAPASVAGRVRLGERGVAGVAVMVLPAEPRPGFSVSGRARTDAEGRYKVSNLAPGRYRVLPSAPGYVVGEAAPRWMGLLVTLAPGESVDDADFTLTRGGVITGRVTDADGRPVVGETVRVASADEDQEPTRTPFTTVPWRTDDRGVYRVYGLPAGRYRVSVGEESNARFAGLGGRARGYYVRTYHPDATDASRAEVVEVTEGGEATDVDVRLGRLARTFKASGRVVNAATGQPAGVVMVAYSVVDTRSGRLGGGGLRVQANARGEFQVEGLLPGSYGVYAVAEGAAADAYSDVTPFQITDADASGLEVRLRPGSSASGVVAVEGVSDPARAAELLRSLSLAVYPDQRQGAAPRFDRVQVNPDGSFTARGLRPGKNFFGAGWPPVRGLTLLRTELNGVEQRGGIEVGEGAHVAGIRLVFAYGAGRVRGQVVLRENGQTVATPEGVRLMVFQRVGGERSSYRLTGEADSRGRFVVENLPSGEVEVMVQATGLRAGKASQLIQVTDGGESSVTLTLDLLPPGQPPQPRPRPTP